MSDVTIIGAGLAGSLLAIYLARRGFTVDVYEARGDMRKQEMSAGRSINLALSDRGIAALRKVGMDEYMLSEAIPMYGRMIHSLEGTTKLLPYSGRQGEYINSVSRGGLNIALINEAERYDGIDFVFNERCIDYDFKSGEAVFDSGKSSRSQTLIATDGAGSAIRHTMMHRGVDRFNFSQQWLEHGYKELHIPPGDLSRNGDKFLIEKHALHIWPRHKFMMIALPNFDGSFTCTLFLSQEGDENSFENLTNENSVQQFFSEHFPDARLLMPTLMEDFFQNPTGNLGTVKCWPWNFKGNVLLLGDSAHAVVPFYGQGMNCAFEDVRVLDSLIEKFAGDWEIIYQEFGKLRKPNTDAIADMAEENFYEMRDAVADPVFQRKRELETKLEQTFPDYFSKYSMVTFREDLPYETAKARGTAQDKFLMDLCAAVTDVNTLDLREVRAKVLQARPEGRLK